MQSDEYDYRQQGSQFADKMIDLEPKFTHNHYKSQQADSVSMYELEQDTLIEKIRHTLAGERYDTENEVWSADKELAPPMNRKGVHHFMLKFGGHLDKNVTLSNFKLEEIHRMMFEICMDIDEIFLKRSVEFGIKQENMDFIKHILEHQILANLKRALDNGERKHRETLIRSVESIRDTQSTSETSIGNKRGLFGFMQGKKQGDFGNGNY